MEVDGVFASDDVLDGAAAGGLLCGGGHYVVCREGRGEEGMVFDVLVLSCPDGGRGFSVRKIKGAHMSNGNWQERNLGACHWRFLALLTAQKRNHRHLLCICMYVRAYVTSEAKRKRVTEA